MISVSSLPGTISKTWLFDCSTLLCAILELFFLNGYNSKHFCLIFYLFNISVSLLSLFEVMSFQSWGNISAFFSSPKLNACLLFLQVVSLTYSWTRFSQAFMKCRRISISLPLFTTSCIKVQFFFVVIKCVKMAHFCL